MISRLTDSPHQLVSNTFIQISSIFFVKNIGIYRTILLSNYQDCCLLSRNKTILSLGLLKIVSQALKLPTNP